MHVSLIYTTQNVCALTIGAASDSTRRACAFPPAAPCVAMPNLADLPSLALRLLSRGCNRPLIPTEAGDQLKACICGGSRCRQLNLLFARITSSESMLWACLLSLRLEFRGHCVSFDATHAFYRTRLASTAIPLSPGLGFFECRRLAFGHAFGPF